MSLDKALAAHQASFVQFAYNMFQPGVLQPPPDPGLAAAGFDLIYHVTANDFKKREFYGYLAASKTNPKELVLAIRGTKDPAEWLLDFLAIPVLFKRDIMDGFVALGFLTIFNSFQFVDHSGAAHKMNDVITALSAAPGLDKITVLGHSLGAALATLAAAQLGMQNPAGVREKLSVYTFASPRVGLLDFASAYGKAVPNSHRIWNTLDIVPETPTFPYIHVNGLGDGIVQTTDQLSTLVVTPQCQHRLTNYQWLLDPAEFPLGAECTVQTSFDITDDEQAVGAEAMRRAMGITE